jgi:alanyl-tRNA synthetase
MSAPEEVEARVAALVDERRRLERELAEAKKQLALAGGGGTAAPAADEQVAGVKFSGQVLQGLDGKELRGLLDEAKKRLGSGVAAIAAVNEARATFAVAVTDDLTSRFNAVDLVRAGVEALGGKGGGGRADMAQGGGPDGGKADDAIAAVRAALAAERVG